MSGNTVSVEHQVIGCHSEAFELRLRDQHPIEGISMFARKPPGVLGVANRDFQAGKPLARQRAAHISGHGLGPGQFADSPLRSDFPS